MRSNQTKPNQTKIFHYVEPFNLNRSMVSVLGIGLIFLFNDISVNVSHLMAKPSL